MRFKISDTTDRGIKYLAQFDKGTLVNYRELSVFLDGLPMDVKRTKYMRYVLERDHSQVWVAVSPNIGLKRLDDVEIAQQLPKWWLRGASRKLKRGSDQVTVVDKERLDIDEQHKLGVNVLQCELALQSLKRATWNRLEKVARGSSNDLPKFNILEWAISLTPR